MCRHCFWIHSWILILDWPWHMKTTATTTQSLIIRLNISSHMSGFMVSATSVALFWAHSTDYSSMSSENRIQKFDTQKEASIFPHVSSHFNQGNDYLFINCWQGGSNGRERFWSINSRPLPVLSFATMKVFTGKEKILIPTKILNSFKH
jgi:hypothetical protein